MSINFYSLDHFANTTIFLQVLCIDEATASVDSDTDQLVQHTLRTEFPHSTVLSIAHRVDTVLQCHRVLVMHQGSVAEYDSPESLLKNKQSRFYALVHGEGEGGNQEADELSD